MEFDPAKTVASYWPSRIWENKPSVKAWQKMQIMHWIEPCSFLRYENEEPLSTEFFNHVKGIQNSKENDKSIWDPTGPVSLCTSRYLLQFLLARLVAWGAPSAGCCLLVLLIAMETECICGRLQSFSLNSTIFNYYKYSILNKSTSFFFFFTYLVSINFFLE